MPEIWLPSHLHPARKAIKVVFWKWRLCPAHPGQKCYCADATVRYTVGFPEQFSYMAPKNVEPIVCDSAAMVDMYDKILSQQERDEQEMAAEKRDAIEAPVRALLPSDLVNRMANARNPVNKEFCRQALENFDRKEKERKEKRESFMHIIGFEDGK